VQLLVDQGNELSQRLLIPDAPSLEQEGYIVSRNIGQTVLSVYGTEANYIPISGPARKKLLPHYSFRVAFPL